MEMVFSLEEIIESFSVSSPVPTPLGILLQGGGGGGVGREGGMINTNASEWCFDKLLEIVEGCNADPAAASPHDRNPSVSRNYDSNLAPNYGDFCSYVEANVCGSRGDLGRVGDHELGGMKALVAPQPSNPVEFVDPGEHQALLKKKLDIVCAAVAMTWGSSVNTQDSASVADSRSPISDVTRPGSQVHTNVGQGRQATSNSSREQSDEDDELEGEAETNNIDPSDKRMRRMISNRESARRSRRRKQTHTSELEAQVSQLRIEHSSLVNRLTGINKKYSDASVNNRILKADLETVRAKVKMAEESLKRATGVNSLYPIISDMSSIDFPFAPSMSNPTPNMALPFQEGTNHFLHASMHVQDVPHGSAPVMQISLATSMPHPASPEQHQNPISSEPTSCSLLQWNAATRFPKTSVVDK